MEAKELEKLVKYYHENKISHAYLIETNNIEKCFLDLKEVVKMIFCKDTYKTGCTNCNLCTLVEQQFLPSFIVIEPDGASIKKEQVLELKRSFSTMPIYTNDNIYVIKHAEKLNGASANTMLKFLEEPDPNIIGFFITDNSNNVISTVRSRCEVIKINYDVHELDINSLLNGVYDDKLNVIFDYLVKLEVEKDYLIMYNKDVILSNFKEREDIKTCFKIMLIIYEELLKKAMGMGNSFLLFSRLSKLESISYCYLTKRIDLIIKVIDEISYNANIDLLLDKFVIELGDIVE